MSNQLTLAQALAKIQALEAANAEANKPRALTLKVSQKGALSLYGMGRFPITLYKEQWLRVLNHAEQLKGFISANDSSLKAKGDATNPVVVQA